MFVKFSFLVLVTAEDARPYLEFWGIALLVFTVCFGSVASVRESLVFVNCDHAEKRVNVTLHTSADGGKTWRRALTVDESRGGYADIAYDPVRGKIYVLYENEYGRELYLAVIDESEVF